MQVRNLKHWRERRLMTQADLAAKSGLSEMTINRIETGRAEPRLHTIRKVAEALDVDASELIGKDSQV